MRRFYTVMLAFVLPFVLFSQTATVNLNLEKQLIKGFGGMNHPTWAGDLTESQRITAFSNEDNQLGLSIVRIYVNEDKNQWSREVATAKKAMEYGALVFASPWNPPTSMTELFTKSGDADAKRLKYDSYAAYAQHLIDFITYMKAQGVKLYAISVQNEPDWGYDWTWWTATEMYNFVKNNVPAIRTAHPDVKIMAAESFGYSKGMTDPILNDDAVQANIDMVGVHTYGVSNPTAYPLLKSKTDKEFWMTEVYHPNSDDNSADRWPEALEVGHHIQKCLVDAEMQAYVWWYIRRQYSPIKEDGTISKRGACMAQFSKFVRPGYVRVDVNSNPLTGVYLSAYKKGNDVVIVAINKNTTPQTINLSIPDAVVPSWQQYNTTSTKNVVKGTTIYSTTTISTTLEAESMSTFVGKMENGTPELIASDPENGSYDLPFSKDTFQFTFNPPVDCSKAIAKMVITPGDTVTMSPLQTGFSSVLTFKLPNTVTLTKGSYKVSVSNLVSSFGLKAPVPSVITMDYGVTTEAYKLDTVFRDNLDGGGLIPNGWKISYSTVVREQNTSGLTSGPRLMDFPNGGNFNAGFYLRDEGSTCKLDYGTYDNAKLYLKAGKHTISFYYSIWKGSGYGIEFAVLKPSGMTVFEQKGITSTNLLAENATVAPTQSTLRTIEFTIAESGYYVLEWRTNNTGFNGVIVGGILLTSPNSVAAMYNKQVSDALAVANNSKSKADSTIYNSTIKTALLNAITEYSKPITAPSVAKTAISTLSTYAASMLTHIQVVDDYLASLKIAKENITTYANSRYTSLNMYQRLVSFANQDNTINYSSDSDLKTATDSLNYNAALTYNYITNGIPALTYRLAKGVELGQKLGASESSLTAAKNALKDDAVIANKLTTTLKSALSNALNAGRLVFGNSLDNPTYTDSLDMTYFIKNPNFYTTQKTTGITSNTFPGWAISAANSSVNAGPSVLASALNPLLSTEAKATNTRIQNFEQTISSLPVGQYNIYLKTRIPVETTAKNTFVFYAINADYPDTLKAEFRRGNADERFLTGFKKVNIKNGLLTIGVSCGTTTGAPTASWGDASLWMVNNVTTGVSNPQISENVKEIQYFTPLGQRIERMAIGLNIVKTIYDDNRVVIQKIIRSK